MHPGRGLCKCLQWRIHWRELPIHRRWRHRGLLAPLPDFEGISLRFEVKVPGVDVRMVSVDMDFGYHEAFGEAGHEAYETLLLDCMLGDATLFTRSDEVEAAWSVVDPIIEFWANKRPDHFPNYPAGSWGPEVGSFALPVLD